MALQLISIAAAAALKKWEKNRETAVESASAEAAVNTQPTGDAVNTQPTVTEPKKPLTLEEKIDQNVTFNGCCAFCSLLCICTIPMLIVVFTAFLVTSVARKKLESGDEEGAERMNSIVDKLNICTTLGNCFLVTIAVLFTLFGLPFIIIAFI